MEIIELLIIAVGVSMDAFAVSICKGLSVPRLKPTHVLSAGLWFGGFQALMPLIGFYLGVSFTDFVSNIDHWIAFVLLGIIGANMIRESFHRHDSCPVGSDFSAKTMFPMAIATSIDALAIGVSFAFLGVGIWEAVIVIGLTTAAFSAFGIIIGNMFGSRYKSKAEFVGGAILIIMGVKILLEHTVL